MTFVVFEGTDVQPENGPQVTPSETDLAWAAGIIDGEGCFHISNARPSADALSRSYSLYLKLTMCDERTVMRFYEMFGVGSVHVVTPGKWNQAWSFLATSWNALEIINQIRPYLFTKIEEADIAIGFMGLARAPRGGRAGTKKVPDNIIAARHELWDRMRRAKSSFRFREERETA